MLLEVSGYNELSKDIFTYADGVGWSVLKIAQYMRLSVSQIPQDVLLFVDNIFRFTQAGSEVA